MSQHSGLTAERWRGFSEAQRILMIGNEMNRATRLMGAADGGSRQLAYERVLRLVDLTVAVAERRASCRELLRWRDLVAELYLDETPQPERHRAAFRILFQHTPTSAAQVVALGL